MVKTFHVGREPSSMFGIDLNLIMAEASLFRLALRHHHRSVCRRAFCQSDHQLQSSSFVLQLTPSASHAASTSGLAGLRYTFSRRNDPLNLITLYERSIWSRRGAVILVNRARYLTRSNLLFCDTRAVHSKFLSRNTCCARSTPAISAKQTFRTTLTAIGHLDLPVCAC